LRIFLFKFNPKIFVTAKVFEAV